MFPGADCDRGREHVPAFIEALRRHGDVQTEAFALTNFETRELVLVRFAPAAASAGALKP